MHKPSRSASRCNYYVSVSRGLDHNHCYTHNSLAVVCDALILRTIFFGIIVAGIINCSGGSKLLCDQAKQEVLKKKALLIQYPASSNGHIITSVEDCEGVSSEGSSAKAILLISRLEGSGFHIALLTGE